MPLTSGAALDKTLYSGQRLTTFATPAVNEIRVIEVLPKLLVFPQVDENCFAPTFTVA
jgi:hypothetical protein